MICPSNIHPSLSPYLLLSLKIPHLLRSLAIILPNDSHLLPAASRVSGGNPYRKLPTKTVQAYPQGHFEVCHGIGTTKSIVNGLETYFLVLKTTVANDKRMSSTNYEIAYFKKKLSDNRLVFAR